MLFGRLTTVLFQSIDSFESFPTSGDGREKLGSFTMFYKEQLGGDHFGGVVKMLINVFLFFIRSIQNICESVLSLNYLIPFRSL